MDYLMVDVVVSAFLERAKRLTDVQFSHSLRLTAYLCFIRVAVTRSACLRGAVYRPTLVFTKEELEDISFILTKADFDTQLCLGKSDAYILVLFKEHAVKGVRESDDSSVLDHVLLFDTDHVLSACLLENASYKFRVASCHEYELEFTFVLLYHLFELLPTH